MNEQDFRRVLGAYTTGVVVITAATPEGPQGFAVNSFTSVSLDPPLVAFCVAHTSTTWPRMRDCDGFAVSVLCAEQEDACRRFATKGADRFSALSWSPAPSGHPVLEGSLAWLDCTLEAVHQAGDHDLIVLRVSAIGDGQGQPLVFHRGRFTRLSDAATTREARFNRDPEPDDETPFFSAIAGYLRR